MTPEDSDAARWLDAYDRTQRETVDPRRWLGILAGVGCLAGATVTIIGLDTASAAAMVWGPLLFIAGVISLVAYLVVGARQRR